VSSLTINAVGALPNSNSWGTVLGAGPASKCQSSGMSGPAATSQVSPAGQLLSQLAQLRQKDPAKYKQLLTDFANQLKAAAQKATGAQAQSLSQLADKVQKAADTGDLSPLKPPQATHGHHHHHGARAYQQAQQSAQPQTLDALTGSADIKALFATFSAQVTKAVG
jgi:hypothetical protein